MTDYISALEEIARDAGLEASCASARNDTASLNAWADVQHAIDGLIKKARAEAGKQATK